MEGRLVKIVENFNSRGDNEILKYLDKEYENIGLNADWSVSVYPLGGNMYAFDIEDGTIEVYKRDNAFHSEEPEMDNEEFVIAFDENDKLDKFLEFIKTIKK